MSGLPSVPSSGTTPASPSSTTSASSSAPSTTSTPSSSNSRQSMTANQFRQTMRENPSSLYDSQDESTSADMPDESANADFGDAPETTPDVAEGAEDTTWLDAVKQYKELHGLPLQDVLQALSEGRIPEQLWSKLSLPLKDGDYEWSDTLDAARNGAMMRRKFTQKMQKFAEERDAFTSERSEFIDYLRGMKEDPRKLLAGLRELGMPFDQAARMYADELHQHEQLLQAEQEGKIPVGTAQALMDKQKLEAEAAVLRMQAQRAQQQQEQQQGTKKTEQVVQAVRTAAAEAFKQVGLRVTDGSWELFKSHIGAIWTVKGNEPPSRAEILEAVRATKEEIDAHQREYYAQQNKQPAAPKMPAAALDGGAPKVQVRTPKNERVTAADFRKRLRDGTWGR